MLGTLTDGPEIPQWQEPALIRQPYCPGRTGVRANVLQAECRDCFECLNWKSLLKPAVVFEDMHVRRLLQDGIFEEGIALRELPCLLGSVIDARGER